MSKFIKVGNKTTKAGIITVFNTTRAKFPYTKVKFIKRNIAEVISTLEPENKNCCQTNLSFQ